MIQTKSRSIMGAKFIEKEQRARSRFIRVNDSTQGHIKAYSRSGAHKIEVNMPNDKFGIQVEVQNPCDQLVRQSRSSNQNLILCNYTVQNTITWWHTASKKGVKVSSLRLQGIKPCGCMVQVRDKNFLFARILIFC